MPELTDRPAATPLAEATLADPAFERAVLRKVTWRLIPFMFALYIVAFLDRVNMSFAALQMNEDLGFTKAEYGFGAGIFFIGYFLFEIPSNLIMERTGARVWIARIMVTWGLISSAMMFVRTPMQLYSLRFLLGLAEAGFFPGMILYLTYWYPRAERARAVAWFMTAIPFSGVIGNPISGLLLKLHAVDVAGWHLELAGWQWLFLLEGIPAVALGAVVLLYLTDRPEKARWLTPEERDCLLERLRREKDQHARHDYHSFGHAVVNARVWLLCLVYFGLNVGSYGLQFWMPKILEGFRLDEVEIGFASAVPNLAAVIFMVAVGINSDQRAERRWHVALCFLIAAAGLFASASSPSLLACVVLLAVATAGQRSTLGPFWALTTSFLGGTAAAGSIALINSVGNLGGMVGPYVTGLLTDATGTFTAGLWFQSSSLALAGLLVLCIRLRHGGKVDG